MYASPHHVRRTGPKTTHQDTLRFTPRTTNHATPLLRTLPAKTGATRGRREGGKDPPGRGTSLGITRSADSTFRFHGLRDPAPSPAPPPHPPAPAQPPGPVRAKGHLLLSSCPFSPGSPRTDTHRTPAPRPSLPQPHSRGEAARAHPSLPPPPGVRVPACPSVARGGAGQGAGGRSSPASPAGPSARGSEPWRRQGGGGEGAGSPQAAPGDGA